MAAHGSGPNIGLPTLTATQLAATGTGGGWTSIGGPRAVTLGSYTYVGLADISGNIVVNVVLAGAITATRTVHASLEASDLHDAPALLVRSSDHKLVTAYSKHVGTTIYVRISANSLDSDPTISGGWGTEQDLDSTLGGTHYTYTALVQLSGESGAIYLFFRDQEDSDNTGLLAYTKSTDGGATWAAETKLLKYSLHTIYWNVHANDSDRIDVGLSSAHPIAETNASVYHLYYTGGAWYTSAGVAIAGSKPYAMSSLTLIYDGTTNNGSIGSIGVDSAGHPTLSYGIITGSTVTSLNWAYWTGSAWATHQIVTVSDSGLYLVDSIVDESSPTTVYIATLVSGVYELFRYYTPDLGVSWIATQITSGSANQGVFYPVMVKNYATGLRLVALFGSYTTYLSNSLGIKYVGT
jgi:hypothetical protein